MDQKNVVLNMLVFANKIAEGADQSVLLKEAAALGFQKVEIRREYIKNSAIETAAIATVAKKLGLELFYSVPDEVFVNGEINPRLPEYLQEAQRMGITKIKWNIGDYAHFTGMLTALRPLLDYGIEINIENDQTQLSGKIQGIATFMKAIQQAQVAIGYVYDLGNWRYVGEDELQAAMTLQQYVRYIHLKDVKMVDDQPETVPLDAGELPWRKILEILPKDLPVAIEYPTSSQEEILFAKRLLEDE